MENNDFALSNLSINDVLLDNIQSITAYYLKHTIDNYNHIIDYISKATGVTVDLIQIERTKIEGLVLHDDVYIVLMPASELHGVERMHIGVISICTKFDENMRDIIYNITFTPDEEFRVDFAFA